LQLPEDPFFVKNRLRARDKLLPQLKDWIHRDRAYTDWHDGEEVKLLHIRGGAGKGKTMLSIGLIEQLLKRRDCSTIVTYFFCQNADAGLNTTQAIIKGLMHRLMEEDTKSREVLRGYWDTSKKCFDKDITSWRVLWDMFMKMTDLCKARRIFMVIDALDECRQDGLGELLKLIDRNGLGDSRIKWLLTSRPLDNIERNLTIGLERKLVSLDLNLDHVASAVKAYVRARVAELDQDQDYEETLRQAVEEMLIQKAEGTFLWVSIVCKRLENVSADEVLAVIEELPLGLHALYDKVLRQLGEGRSRRVERCMRLLKVMLLVYRPMQASEVASVAGIEHDGDTLHSLTDQCASFIRRQDDKIEFLHQSARDYLSGEIGQAVLGRYAPYGHYQAVIACLGSLSRVLKPDLLGLERPDATRAAVARVKDASGAAVLASVEYAAAFWTGHSVAAMERGEGEDALGIQDDVQAFLQTRLLE